MSNNKKFILLTSLILSTTILFAQKTKKQMIYQNEEITIKFHDSYQEVEDGQFWSITNGEYTKGYFHDFLKKIRFHEDHQQKYFETEDGQIITTQHVISSDNYLSSLFIYPALEEKKLLKEIEKAFAPTDRYVSYRNAEKRKIGKVEFLNWRMQRGKSRLEHFLVLGKKFNYLFISTPYGEQEYIEDIISKIEFK